MKGIVLILRRFVSATMLISFFLLVLNFLLLGLFIFNGMDEEQSPEEVVRTIAAGLSLKGEHYSLNESAQSLLEAKNAWSMLINNSGNVIWNTSLPEEIPLSFTLTDVAKFSRHYLMDYPVFIWEHSDGLVIVGYPKSSYAKYYLHSSVSWIKTLPLRSLALLIGNIALGLVLSLIIGTKLIKSIKPLVGGIHALANEKPVLLESKGIFNDLAGSINHTSTILQDKNKALKVRDEARANWIAGISHDIRTPLSMILGYSSQLEENKGVPSEHRKHASIIRQQAEKLRSLVSDLNLVSMLEYEMQPLYKKTIRLSSIARHVASEFLNNGLAEKYKVALQITTENSLVEADENLLLRALTNLIQNSIYHNPMGCEITLITGLSEDKETAYFIVEDNGKGIEEEKLKDLFELPYSLKRKRAHKNGHGLGIPIVAKIAEAHKGQLVLENEFGKGLKAIIKLPAVK